MRRPRHREKSNLLWKMVGVAGAVNIVLWPILIHEGVFAGVRHETLIPVSLVSLPPSKKLPDTLQKVARATPTPLPAKAGPTAAKVPPPPRPPSHQSVAATVVKPVTPHTDPSNGTRVASADIPKPHIPLSTPHPVISAPSVVHKPQSHSTAGVHSATGSLPPHVHVPTAEERSQIAARLARAKEREAEARLIAEKITHDRAAQAAAVPPDTSAGTSSGVPSAGPTLPGTTNETTVASPDTVAIVEAPKPTPKPPAVKVDTPAAFVPAVVVSKVYPTVPDRMLTTALHTTFQGEMIVHKDGTATVRMVSSTGHPVLDHRAIEAAQRWKFRPARLNGKTVTVSRPVVFVYDVHPLH